MFRLEMIGLEVIGLKNDGVRIDRGLEMIVHQKLLN